MGHYQGAHTNEIWVGNCLRSRGIDEVKSRGVTSARMGDVALDIYGKTLPSDYAPVFISRAQELVYDDYMMRKTFGPHWRR